jgi:hypothetical protein
LYKTPKPGGGLPHAPAKYRTSIEILFYLPCELPSRNNFHDSFDLYSVKGRRGKKIEEINVKVEMHTAKKVDKILSTLSKNLDAHLRQKYSFLANDC